MFGRRKDRQEILGVHVGRDALTVVRVVKRPGAAEVTGVFHEPLQRNPSTWPVERVSAALRHARRGLNMRAEEVRMTLASDLAPASFLILPSVKGEQLANAVKLQLENKRGNTGADLCFEVIVLEKRGERCRVFAPCLPRETLRLILTSFLEVNCPVDTMEVEAVSLTNLLVQCGLTSTDPIAALDVGPGGSEIHIIRRKKIALSRPISRPEADAAKGEEDGKVASAPAPAENGGNGTGLNAAYSARIVREANKTLDYFEIELLSPPVTRLLLFGEGAAAPELPPMLARDLELEVGLLETGTTLKDETGQFEPTRHGLAAAAALGEGVPDES